MRIWMDKPPAIVSIYFPTAANSPNPVTATTLVIRPRTPKGANLMTIWVMFIITSNEAEKKSLRVLEYLVLIRVSPTPKKIAKKIGQVKRCKQYRVTLKKKT